MAEVIWNHEQLAEKIASLKAVGKKIILANGCFDLLHVGHVRYLWAAKALGDVLVVALNSDHSVKRLKGKERPLLPLEDRLGIFSHFEMVDFVTPFDTDTVEPLLLKIKPDIHAKGTDYTPETVPERSAVASYGGRVATVGDPKNHASRDLIREILEKYGSISKGS
jgi:rfaE bifunctional protein nucleotidyltransferase chain/domain